MPGFSLPKLFAWSSQAMVCVKKLRFACRGGLEPINSVHNTCTLGRNAHVLQNVDLLNELAPDFRVGRCLANTMLLLTGHYWIGDAITAVLAILAGAATSRPIFSP